MQYVFKGPTYRPFAYERLLAEKELTRLVGRPIVWDGDPLTISVRRSLPISELQRLAFISSIEAPGGTIPTHTHLLEQSASHARNGFSSRRLDGDLAGRKESSYLTHGLHRYKGKFYPQLCRALINIAGLGRGDLVLDPFMGSGTTLVESIISGIDSVGFDLNPLAYLIASTKVELLRTSPTKLRLGLTRFERSLASECRRVGLRWQDFHSQEPDGSRSFLAAALAEECELPEAAGELARWFPPAICQKLVAVVRASKLVKHRALRMLIQVCLSDQIRSVSQQDPRDLRIRRRTPEILDAPLLSQLSSKLLRELEKLRLGIGALRPARVGVASAELRDARVLERSSHSLLSKRLVDAVVTSPPYANALPYIDTDRLSLLVLGLLSSRARYALQKRIIGNREIHGGERRSLELEMSGPTGLRTFPSAASRQIRTVLNENQRHAVGFRRKNVPALLFQYFRDMRAVMARLYDVVRPGGNAFMVLGNSMTTLGNGDELAIRTTEHISALAEQVGWKGMDIEPITVTVEDVAHSRHAITDNYILRLYRGQSHKAHFIVA